MTGARWVADPSIGWRILLTARLPGAGAGPDTGAGQRLAQVQHRLTEPHPDPVRVVRTDDAVVISAHHAAVDGLGLLELLDRAGHGPVRSAARGIGAGDGVKTGSLASGIRDRLAEALLRPPALPRAPLRAGGPGDVLVEGEVPGSRRTAALVHAAALAVGDWQAARGGSARHVSVAVGASGRVRAPGEEPADDSVLLRLRDLEGRSQEEVAALLRAAVPEPSPQQAGGSRVLAAALGLGMRVLAPRLGSTLLVSHLGEVTAPAVERLTFHPVTAGGSGISLGAVGHAGSTTLTLRARARRWDDDGLEQLLEAIIHRL